MAAKLASPKKQTTVAGKEDLNPFHIAGQQFDRAIAYESARKTRVKRLEK